MGALARATKREVEELSRGDPEWWPSILADIAEGRALSEVATQSAWSWGALWAWIQADESRLAQYDAALKARAQMLAFSALDEVGAAAIADVSVRKLRADTYLRVAGKWDRGRYGDATEVKHSGTVGMNLMAVLASLPRAGAAERVVAEVPAEQPVLAAYETLDEI
jgi:hypothetical protein